MESAQQILPIILRVLIFFSRNRLFTTLPSFHAIDVWKPLLRRRFITAKEHEFWKRTHQSGPRQPCACSDIMAEYSTRAWRSLCERTEPSPSGPNKLLELLRALAFRIVYISFLVSLRMGCEGGHFLEASLIGVRLWFQQLHHIYFIIQF